MQGEAASADAEAAASCPEGPAEIINEDGYTEQHICSVDETALHWKMPSQTFIAREEKPIADFKASEDRLTLLLGDNAAGASELEPLFINHSENPMSLKNYAESTLCVIYKWHNKAWMTHVFTILVIEYFKPTVETYCSEKKIFFKLLLLIDNVPGHPRAL